MDEWLHEGFVIEGTGQSDVWGIEVTRFAVVDARAVTVELPEMPETKELHGHGRWNCMELHVEISGGYVGSWSVLNAFRYLCNLNITYQCEDKVAAEPSPAKIPFPRWLSHIHYEVSWSNALPNGAQQNCSRKRQNNQAISNLRLTCQHGHTKII